MRKTPVEKSAGVFLFGLAQRHQRKLLEQNLRCELAGVGGGIVLRCDLDHIGAERFHFRVRNGIGWFPLAMAARQTV